MKADLHNHTLLSDGALSVEDLIKYAKAIKLDYISVTDHDTTSGIVPALILGEKLGVKVIPGVEISTVDKLRNRSVHILCYYPKDIVLLQGFLNKILIKRDLAKRQMAQLLMKDYPVLPEHIEKYRAKSDSMYETHIMQPLADLGYTDIVLGRLYKELLAKRGKYYVQIEYPSVEETLRIIKEVGGIAVMAHPGQFDSIDLLEELASSGKLHGVEYNHPRNTENVKIRIKEIAERYNMILTGGTDFHGNYTSKPVPMGTFLCPEDHLLRLIDAGNQK